MQLLYETEIYYLVKFQIQVVLNLLLKLGQES